MMMKEGTGRAASTTDGGVEDFPLGEDNDELMAIKVKRLATAVELTSTFRSRRDACRDGQDVQIRLLDHVDETLVIIQELLRVLTTLPLDEEEKMGLRRPCLAGLQFLGNLTTGNSTASEALWERFFPEGYLDLIEEVGQDRGLLNCVFMMLHNCLVLSHHPSTKARLLADSSALLCSLLRRSLPPHQPPPSQPMTGQDGHETVSDPVFEWVSLIVSRLLEYGQGSLALARAGVEVGSSSSGPVITPEQLILLHLMEHTLDTTTGHIPASDSTSSSSSNGGVPLLLCDGGDICVDLVRRVIGLGVYLDNKATDEGPEVKLLVQEAATTIIRILGQALGACDDSSLRDRVVEEGLAEEIIQGLRRLGGKANGKIPQEKEAASPSLGRKSNLIRALANLCYRCRAAQDRVRQCEGIALVLNHCNYDSDSPYLREWSLLAIRNLCADNLENQGVVERMKPQEAIGDAALRRAGVEPVLVEQGGRGGPPRVRLRRVEKEEG